MVGPMGKEEYEERYGEEVGRCNVHKVNIVDRSCIQCDDTWVCLECGDVCYNDPRVQQGLKCWNCAYAYMGGE